MSETQTLAFFQALEKEVAKLVLDEETTLELTLNEVIPKERQPPGWECFTLLFTSPRELILEQAIYPVTFTNGKQVDLFLVPVDADKEIVEYEAIFSRRLEKK